MGESIAHKTLKKHACRELKKEGFTKHEIYEEYCVKQHNRLLRVDIAGVNKEKKVAYECGRLSYPKKIQDLQSLFDKVVWMPYMVFPLTHPTPPKPVHIFEEKCRDVLKRFLESHPNKNFTAEEIINIGGYSGHSPVIAESHLKWISLHYPSSILWRVKNGKHVFKYFCEKEMPKISFWNNNSHKRLVELLMNEKLAEEFPDLFQKVGELQNENR